MLRLVALVATVLAVHCELTTVLKAPELPAGFGWTTLRQARLHETLRVTVVLKGANLKKLEDTAIAVSNPLSSSTGKFLTAVEIAAVIAPPAEAIQEVINYLTLHQASFRVGPTKDMIYAEMTAQQVASAFNTAVHIVENNATRQIAVRCGDIQLPTSVAAHIRTILGVHGLPLPPRTFVKAADDAYPVTPSVIWNRYKVGGVTPRGSLLNSQAVAEFQGQYMNAQDLTTFFQKYVPNAQPGDDTVSKFVGDNTPGEGIEALLDIEYIMGVSPHIKTEFWEYPAMDFCGDLVQWTQAILSDATPPKVHSVSYGWQGPLSQLGCQQSDIDTVDNEFLKLAAAGITIIFASGDTGAAPSGGRLWPSWPASSPWVTAVGSTRFINQQPGAEMATDQFGSGGGFSDQFAAASWQQAAIASYFSVEPKDKLPPASMYNRSGRATPDVCALGEGYQVVEGGQTISVGGTSASAPAFAAMVSQLNEARAQHGKGPLGFLNLWMYQNPGMFQDVTVGSNRWGRGPYPLQYGWDCVPGGDPATGLGSPDFPKMLTAALARA